MDVIVFFSVIFLICFLSLDGRESVEGGIAKIRDCFRSFYLIIGYLYLIEEVYVGELVFLLLWVVFYYIVDVGEGVWKERIEVFKKLIYYFLEY